MAIDSSIYSQIQQPKPVNMLAEYANLMQVQGAQQANKLNQLKFAAAERETQEAETLNRLYAGAMNPDGTMDRTRLLSGAASSGLGSRIPGLQKTFAESDKAAVDADTAKFKLAKDRHDVFQQTLGSLAQDPNLSKDLVLQAGQGLVAQGILPKAIFDQAISGLPDDPAQLRAKVLQSAKFRMTPDQIFSVFAPKPTEVNDGQVKSFRDMNPNSPTYGQATGGAPVQMQASPDAQLSAQTTRRGQNLTDARARERLAFDQEQPRGVLDPERGLLVDPRTGQARPVTMGGQPVGMKVAPEARKELMSINQQRAAIGGAIQAAEKSPTAFGFWRGIAASLPGGETVAGRMETMDETQARAYVFNNVSRIINERAGAAQSAQELARLQQFLPGASDNQTQIVNKLKGFNKYLDDLERGTRTPAGGAAPAGNTGGASGSFGDDPLGLRM